MRIPSVQPGTTTERLTVGTTVNATNPLDRLPRDRPMSMKIVYPSTSEAAEGLRTLERCCRHGPESQGY
jgi:hypothetical protein